MQDDNNILLLIVQNLNQEADYHIYFALLFLCDGRLFYESTKDGADLVEEFQCRNRLVQCCPD